MFAHLTAFNTITGKSSSASVEFSGNPDDTIQLKIINKRYIFNDIGDLIRSENVPTCDVINPIIYSCAQPQQKFTCVPTFTKNED